MISSIQFWIHWQAHERIVLFWSKGAKKQQVVIRLPVDKWNVLAHHWKGTSGKGYKIEQPSGIVREKKEIGNPLEIVQVFSVAQWYQKVSLSKHDAVVQTFVQNYVQISDAITQLARKLTRVSNVENAQLVKSHRFLEGDNLRLKHISEIAQSCNKMNKIS